MALPIASPAICWEGVYMRSLCRYPVPPAIFIAELLIKSSIIQRLHLPACKKLTYVAVSSINYERILDGLVWNSDVKIRCLKCANSQTTKPIISWLASKCLPFTLKMICRTSPASQVVCPRWRRHPVWLGSCPAQDRLGYMCDPVANFLTNQLPMAQQDKHLLLPLSLYNKLANGNLFRKISRRKKCYFFLC